MGIRDVARAAGVSIATVSRAFNQPDTVNETTRSRVVEAARRLSYIPDGAARALSSQRNFRIGALIPTIDDSIFARFITALQRRLGDDGYRLLVGISESDPRLEMTEIRSLIEGGVDALVLCGEKRSEEIYDLIRARDLAYVVTHIYRPESPHATIGYDNREGALNATRYLLELGHRAIGIIDNPIRLNDRAEWRLEGVSVALAERGLDLPPSRHIERPFSIEDGRLGLRTLLEQNSGLTGIICGNDVLATGVLFEARARGVSVPEDLSIIGFDDLELAAQVSPALTTIHVPSGEMGTRTAETLLLKLAEKPHPHATKIGTNLVIRGTTGPIPHRAPGGVGVVAPDRRENVGRN
ncbi:MAG: LacI family DNA-binding transcriptional regulator [Alphaproteobacteria bacterium]|nr:LacI family DNA-binding transcriptional regulator [Alphaproteobacteria bacterium]